MEAGSPRPKATTVVPCDVVRSPDPGTIIYEDTFQIGVLPCARMTGEPAGRRQAAEG
ncbi:hypothetical protein [Nonomuraea zeae]|uniref:hypothetical protein n=1 Tax=Nonomuraea zeae TaxID=1642303 RepID=UPI001479277E|nr:hypothetical protein [Nonomuraea zeae]